MLLRINLKYGRLTLYGLQMKNVLYLVYDGGPAHEELIINWDF